MKLATSISLTANVHGNRRSVCMVPGTCVDLDQVVAVTDAGERTLEQELGPELVALLQIAAPAEAPVGRRRQAQDKE